MVIPVAFSPMQIKTTVAVKAASKPPTPPKPKHPVVTVPGRLKHKPVKRDYRDVAYY